jgi:hypothetical protein
VIVEWALPATQEILEQKIAKFAKRKKNVSFAAFAAFCSNFEFQDVSPLVG